MFSIAMNIGQIISLAQTNTLYPVQIIVDETNLSLIFFLFFFFIFEKNQTKNNWVFKKYRIFNKTEFSIFFVQNFKELLKLLQKKE